MAVVTDTITSLGDDQMASQYTLLFPEGIPNVENPDALSLRLRGTFKIPTESWFVYEVFYKGRKFPKKGMLQETDKMFTVECRLDQGWAIYDDLYAWAQLSYDQNTGESAGDYATRTSMIFRAEDTKQASVRDLLFTGVGVKSLDISEFSYESGEPIYITMELIFNDYIPQY